jgi:hypothetical protein
MRRLTRIYAKALWRGLAFAVLIALAGGPTEHASAADFTVLDPHAINKPDVMFFEPQCNVAISGEITAGDYEKVEAGLYAFALDLASRNVLNSPPKYGRRISWTKKDKAHFALCLASEGGDLREALKISWLFGIGDWITVIEAGEPCLSACAMLFLRAAGPRFSLTEHVGYGGRYAHYSAKLGFHAPYLDVPKQGDAPPARKTTPEPMPMFCAPHAP